MTHNPHYTSTIQKSNPCGVGVITVQHAVILQSTEE